MIDFNPRITVVTVCYNVAATIEKTIVSVINQTYDNLEYIIVDGASTDGTVDIIKKYEGRITKWVSESDQGIYDAMNKGIYLATGLYILFLNSSDYLISPQTIFNMVSKLEANTDVLYGKGIRRSDKGDEVDKIPSIDKIRRYPVFRHNAALFRLSLQRKFKFDLSMSSYLGFSLDYDSIYKMYLSGAVFKAIDDIVISYDLEGVSNDLVKSAIYDYRVTHRNGFILEDWIRLQLRIVKCWVMNRF